MILRWGQQQQRASVSNRQHADFLSVEALFDNDLIARRTKLAVHGNPLDRVQRILLTPADEDTLARGKPVGLDH